MTRSAASASRLGGLCLAALGLLLPTAPASAAAYRAPGPRVEAARGLEVPDEELLDQDGRPVRLRSGLLRGRPVLINFIFTRCTTICSPMSATLARVQAQLPTGSPVRLVSISLDPAHDTPERLKAFGERFGRREGWTLLTGAPDRIARVLQALGGLASVKEAHQPMFVLGDEARGRWTRLFGLAPPSRLLAELQALQAGRAPGQPAQGQRPAPARPREPPKTAEARARERAAAAYFTDLEVVDQEGRPHRFYTDLVRGKKVLIHFGFTSCKGGCSPAAANLRKVQKQLGARVGQDVHILTLTVDPTRDTPDSLRRFARALGAGPGWYFLTGAQENVSAILKKLGGFVSVPDAHSFVLLIGDESTGVWVKSHANATPASIVHTLEHLNEG